MRICRIGPVAPMKTDVLSKVVSALKSLDQEGRVRLLRTVVTYFDIPALMPSLWSRSVGGGEAPAQQPTASFSEDRTTSPKEFLFDKKPVTDTERVACLAYYLTHYRNTPHFRTLDISKLNTKPRRSRSSRTLRTQ